ncbi:MAG: phosphoribosyltransferase family protein, partial [Thermodesulfovibrionales bacterium]|nr:phosphoribosyltransferase family protein [Thermodesulfovibrionales bacterium]
MAKELLNNKDIQRIISRMAHEIIEHNKGVDNLCLVGIQRGGVHLAKRISQKINEIENVSLPIGCLLYTSPSPRD